MTDRALRALERDDTVSPAQLARARERAGLCGPHGRHACRLCRRRERDLERAQAAAEELREYVAAVNGRCRERTADPDEIVQAVVDVAKGGGDWSARGRLDRDQLRPARLPPVGYWTTGRPDLPGSYGYPATYTGVDVARVGTRVYVRAARLSTSRETPLGCSDLEPAGWGEATIRELVTEAALALYRYPGCVVIPTRIARLLGCEEGLL